MQRSLWFVVLVCGGLACNSNAADSSRKDEDNKAQGKGTVVNLDGLRSRTPSEWKEVVTASRMRLMQFRLPRVEGDPNDAELVIYKNLGGSARENVKRWKDQFRPPSGKSIDDVTTVK